MWFNKKPSVRRLDPVGFSGSPDLPSKLLLVFVSTKMLNNGIGEYYVVFRFVVWQLPPIPLDVCELHWRR